MPRAVTITLRVLLALLLVALGLGAVGGAMWLGDWVHQKTYIEKDIPDYDPTKPIPAEALKEDFAMIRRVIENEHGAPYLYTPKEALSAMFDAAYRKLNRPMNELEFVKLVGPIIHAVHDGHTNVSLPRTFRDSYVFEDVRIFPAVTFIGKDKVVVWKDGTLGGSLPRGSEIVEVDGEPVEKLVQRVSSLFYPTDGYTSGAARQQLEAAGDLRDSFSAYLAYLWSFPKAYDVTLRTRMGTRKVRVEGVSVPRVFRTIQGRYPSAEPDEAATRLHWEGATPVLTLDSFAEGSFGEYAEALERAFTEIHDRGARSLVIDLRKNGGGETGRPLMLLKYLLEGDRTFLDGCEAKTFRSEYERYAESPRATLAINQLYKLFLMRRDEARGTWRCKNAVLTGELNLDNPPFLTFPDVNLPPFGGSIYLLVSGSTFSAGSEFAAFAKAYLDPLTVIGQETGGTATGLVGSRYWTLTLPNTRLRLRIPLVKIEFVDSSEREPGRGVLPDVEVWPTFEDALEGRDRVMETALDLIKDPPE